jgi:predicted GTPase
MDAVVLCDVKFGAGPIQAAIDYLVVEKHYRVTGAAIVARKLPEGFSLDVPFVVEADARAAVKRAAAEFVPRALVDLTESDLEYRFGWVNEALQLGLEVHGADFRLWPPALRGRDVPTVTFVGAGPAVGKTAAIVSFLEEAKTKYKTSAVVLDLGGPPYPEIVEPLEAASAPGRLLSFHRDGRDVGGDHYLIATAAGVPAVGCSFAGTGFTGVPLHSLLGDAFVFAGEAGGELAVVEGSGRAMPPVVGEVCFLVNVLTEPESLSAFLFAYQLRRAAAVIATGFEPNPAADVLGRLEAAAKAVNERASFCYGRIVAAAVGEPGFKDAVVVTARPASAREGLASFWGKKIRGAVLEMLGGDQFPPGGATAKALRRAAGEAGILVDMAVPNLGEWLEWADSWDVPVGPTYESLALSAPVFEPLLRKAVKAARGRRRDE